MQLAEMHTVVFYNGAVRACYLPEAETEQDAYPDATPQENGGERDQAVAMQTISHA
jgi:hypothetical protein